jgi:hypothetical protein
LIYSTSAHSTEVIIQRTIDGIQRIISVRNNNSQGEKEEGAPTGKEPTTIEISLAMRRHWESEIKILRDAPRDLDKLRELLKIRQRQYEKARLAEEIQPLVTEIEMLEFVLFLVCKEER